MGAVLMTRSRTDALGVTSRSTKVRFLCHFPASKETSNIFIMAFFPGFTQPARRSTYRCLYVSQSIAFSVCLHQASDFLDSGSNSVHPGAFPESTLGLVIRPKVGERYCISFFF
jgi:hypothetical protein